MALIIHGEGTSCFDPELKYSKAGKAYMRLRLVSKERQRNASGQWEDGQETFFNLTVFGKPAEMLAESNAGKGSRVVFSGKARMESWTNKDGVEKWDLSVIADHIGLDLQFTAYTRLEQAQAARGAARRAEQTHDDFPTDESPF